MQEQELEKVIAEINASEAKLAKFRKVRDNIWYTLMAFGLLSIILFLWGVIPL